MSSNFTVTMINSSSSGESKFDIVDFQNPYLHKNEQNFPPKVVKLDKSLASAIIDYLFVRFPKGIHSIGIILHQDEYDVLEIIVKKSFSFKSQLLAMVYLHPDNVLIRTETDEESESRLCYHSK
jgi:hypothetical protein